MCVCVYACVGVLLCEHIMCGYYACGRQRSLSSITFICLSVSEAGSLSEPRAHGLIRLVYFHALRTCLSNQPHTWLGIWLLQIWAQIILTVLKFFFQSYLFFVVDSPHASKLVMGLLCSTHWLWNHNDYLLTIAEVLRLQMGANIRGSHAI